MSIFSEISSCSLQRLFFVGTVLLTPMWSTCAGDTAEGLAYETAVFAADNVSIGKDKTVEELEAVGERDPFPELPVAPVLKVNEELPLGYSLRRVVGIAPADGVCPEGNDDWETIPVSSTTLVKGKERRFCAYRWANRKRTPAPNNLPSFCGPKDSCAKTVKNGRKGEDGPQWLGPDDMGIFRASLPPAAQGAIADAIRAQHKLAIEMLHKMPRGQKYHTHLPRRVKVYVLDDSEDGNRSLHGDAVAKWILNNSCTGKTCGIWMHRRNVFDPDGLGSAGALARAIEAAVADAAGWPAIINLSLELHPERVASHGSLPNPDDDVVTTYLKMNHRDLESALRQAACAGIPVIAAAGNRETGKVQEIYEGVPGRWWAKNVSFPAAFGRVGRDTQQFCPNSSAPDDLRLAYAAGAINYNGSFAPSTRLNGQPCLTAPSAGLTVEGLAIEGTSFSAAAMTAAAAAVMRYAPFEDGHGVMNILRSTAEPLLRNGQRIPSDACEFKDEGDVRRINVCAAVREALDKTCLSIDGHPERKIYGFACQMAKIMWDKDMCGSIDTTAQVPMDSGPAEELRKIITEPADPEDPEENEFFVGRNFQVLTEEEQQGEQEDPCPGTLLTDDSFEYDYSCPDDQLEDGMADADRSRPSPGGYGCGGCAVTVDGNTTWLVGTLTSEYVLSPTVSLGVNGAEQTFALGDDLLQNAEGFAIKLSAADPDAESAPNVTHASFSYQEEQGTQGDVSHNMGLPVIEIQGQDP